jgi:uncharacterized membrane protein YphA (DoxX/SURF4 family)
MPRAARRRLIALAIAVVIGLLTTCAAWLVSIGYFSSVNAPDESLALRKAARQALADITEYRKPAAWMMRPIAPRWSGPNRSTHCGRC